MICKYGEPGEEYFILQQGQAEVKVIDDDGVIEEIKTIADGTGFGELALMYRVPRSATITCLTDCTLWVMNRQTFKKIIYAKYIQNKCSQLRFLDQVQLFDNLDRYKKIRLLNGIQILFFQKDEVIVTENEIGELFYIIEEGKVACTKWDEETKS